jgi:hypothetical protein
MALRFAVRGTQLNAWYGPGGVTSSPFSNLGYETVDVVANANPGVFGGYCLDMTPISVIKGLIWPGRANVCVDGATSFSVLARIVPNATESPWTSTYGIIEVGNMRGGYGYGFRVGTTNGGKVFMQVSDAAGNFSIVVGTTTLSTTANVPFDLMLTWDGTTTAGAVKVSKDGVEIDTMTAPLALASPYRKQIYMREIISGSLNVTAFQNCQLNELLLWDSVENHVYAARTGFWSVASFDGTSYTDPGIANVRSATGYTYAGATQTGTLAVPTAGNVRLGTSVDAGTGTLDLPSEANVKTGVTFDGVSKTGTYTGADRWTDPGVANVRLATGYTANNIAKTGTLDLPSVANVKLAINFDNATKTGTLESTDPGIANVLDGTSYKIESVTKVGTLEVDSTDPGIANVKDGVEYEILGVAKEGTLVSTDPGITNVRNGIQYTIESVNKTGTWGNGTGNGIVGQLIANLDNLLSVRDDIGAAKKTVKIMTRTWDGDSLGEGNAVETLVQMLPSPQIVEFEHDFVLKSGGSVQQGDIMLKMVSKQGYTTQAMVDCSSNDLLVEKFYEVGGFLYQVIHVTEGYVTWNIHLRRTSDQTRY